MNVRTLAVTAGCLLLLSGGAARAQLLYDGSSGVTPDNNQWNWNYASLGGTASNTASGGAAILGDGYEDTSAHTGRISGSKKGDDKSGGKGTARPAKGGPPG